MSFLTGYVLGMTLNQSPQRSYHGMDFEKEQLKIKCRELENQNADLSKKVERLQEQLKEANEIIKYYDEKYGEHYEIISEGIVMGNSPAWKYMLKWGVK